VCPASGCGAGSTNYFAERDLQRHAFLTALSILARSSNPEGRGRDRRSNPHLVLPVALTSLLVPPESCNPGANLVT
jgi:hypothetical protein